MPTASVLVEARLMPAVESPVPRRSMAGRFLGRRVRCSGPDPVGGTWEEHWDCAVRLKKGKEISQSVLLKARSAHLCRDLGISYNY